MKDIKIEGVNLTYAPGLWFAMNVLAFRLTRMLVFELVNARSGQNSAASAAKP